MKKDKINTTIKTGENFPNSKKDISQTDNPRDKLDVLFDLAQDYSKKGDFHLSLKTLDNALNLAIESRNDDGMASAYHMIGTVYFKIKNYDKATENYLNALSLREAMEAPEKIAATLNNLSIIYIETLKYDTALECLFKALSSSEFAGDNKSVSGICNNIGILYLRNGEIDKANQYFEKSLKTIKSTGDEKILSNLYMNIAMSLCESQSYRDSLEYFEKSIELKRKIDDPWGLSSAYLNLGEAHKNLGNFEEALGFLNKSLKERVKIGDKKDLAMVNSAIGSVYSGKGDMLNAREYFEKAYFYSTGIEMAYHRKEIVKNMAEISRKLGDLSRAYDLIVEYYQIQENINENEKKSRMREIELNYEIDRIERENKIVSERNTELEKTKRKLDYARIELKKIAEELSSAVQSKDNLFDLISQDIRNSLDFVQTNLNFLALKGNVENSEISQSLKSVFERVNYSRLLIEKIARIFELENPSFGLKLKKEDLNTLIGSLMPSLKEACKDKNIDLELCACESSLAVYLDKIAFEEILDSILVSMIKFAKRDSLLELKLSKNVKESFIKIKYNGPGMFLEYIPSFDEKIQASTRIGLDLDKEIWLSLLIAKKLIELHRGKFSIDNDIHKGTEFTISLPLA
ncbi:tetratricopeptide repeat protein [candidate division WOR-3 bacterium]|nr:tetratricopeptide repeat protein [candidate division WOR-3 bacterium]